VFVGIPERLPAFGRAVDSSKDLKVTDGTGGPQNRFNRMLWRSFFASARHVISLWVGSNPLCFGLCVQRRTVNLVGDEIAEY
jgi:hypothetical protein